ncbi:glycosyltransferase [Halorubrum sp. SD690R]|uniref:glycosyltransferase n=1 Tax=Halorubrum sp. SD690R TaxID=2518117 RepID=UPI001A7EED4E|nr:glycosyltransferase [Halorubrum sp. SD690R]
MAVILPVYNGEEEVRPAINSLIEQTTRPTEILLVNDGSTDNTAEILSEYERQYSTVQVLTHETNKGLPTALNTAIEATGKPYIARQDADDRSLPNRIEEQYRYMKENPSVDITGTAADVVDGEGNTTGTIYPPQDPPSGIQEQNPFVHGSVMMRREAVEDVGGYNPLFKNSQDYDLWVRLDRAGYRLGSIQSVLYCLKREEGYISIEQRQQRVLYGLVARAEPDKKEEYREIIQNQGIRSVYGYLNAKEKAIYNRQSAEICIKQNSWMAAIREITPVIRNDPLSVRTIIFLLLCLFPPLLSRQILKKFQSF